ncbi:hypothetical protein F889_01551 [Acinetobacter colistiniresistens]|uniref:Superinfection exclusion protein B n=1 Tax=Acinetobacter colistiniresistens TaxID=280145 RepID=N9QXV8_9GAMM|nr:super-infection exclusion protein B [Acinetobacter colistiniresistens]ENX34911.1 hypothetical protein F889_01551 [Acinetobacter colistiniresistens]
MVENVINAVLDIFRKHNILLYGVLIVSGVLTYNIWGLSDITGFIKIEEKYKNYTALAFLFSTTIVFLLVFKSIVLGFKSYVVERSSKITAKATYKEKLVNLTKKERAVLLQFFIQESETIWLPWRGQEVVELVNAGVLNIASNSLQMTRAGEAALLKIQKSTMHELATIYSDTFSNKHDSKVVQDILQNHTPESVKAVLESRHVFGY